MNVLINLQAVSDVLYDDFMIVIPFMWPDFNGLTQYYFFCGSVNYAVSSSDYIGLKDKVIDEWICIFIYVW
jgi:hypothetical protein